MDEETKRELERLWKRIHFLQKEIEGIKKEKKKDKDWEELSKEFNDNSSGLLFW